MPILLEDGHFAVKHKVIAMVRRFHPCLPLWGADSGSSERYCGFVTRITTPFDAFMSDMLLWLETAWYLWVALGIVVLVVVVVVSVVVARMRSRGYERVPHYFRQNS